MDEPCERVGDGIMFKAVLFMGISEGSKREDKGEDKVAEQGPQGSQVY